MARLGAKYVLDPLKNAFPAITTLHPPGQQETGWYSANAFIYAVQVRGSGSGHPQCAQVKWHSVALVVSICDICDVWLALAVCKSSGMP